MRIPDPKANTTTEAYLAYKAGYLEESELKPVLYEPYLHFDAWLAYWAGLTNTYPVKNVGKNLLNMQTKHKAGWEDTVQGITFTLQDDGGVYMAGTSTGTQGNGAIAVIIGKIWESSDIVVPLNPTKSYRISVIRPDNKYRFFIRGIRNGVLATIASNNANTITGCSGITLLQVEVSGGDTVDGAIYLQLEEGSSATSYEPYSADPEMLCDEEALVAYLSGVTDTYPEEIKDPYDVRIVGYLKHLASIRWPEPDYPVNNEEFYLSTMEPTHTSNPEPSSDIELDTAEGKIIGVEAYGDTYQQTYSGKNLFNYNDTLEVSSGITVDDNGFISITADNPSSATSNVYKNYFTNRIDLETSTNYAVVVEVKSVSGTGRLIVTSNNQTNTTNSQVAENKTVEFASLTSNAVMVYTVTSRDSFSSPEAGLRTYAQFRPGNSGSITFRLSVLSDTSITPETFVYEPYTGGIPAPNPDYPQDIQVVTGEQTVMVSGKNLYNLTSGPTTESGVTGIGTTEYFTMDGVVSGVGGRLVFNECTLPAGTYTATTYCDSGEIVGNVNFCVYKKNTWTQVTPFTAMRFIPSKIGTSKTATFTLSEETSLWFSAYLNTNASFENLKGRFQLEKGSTATDYEPYQSQSYTINLGKNLFNKSDTSTQLPNTYINTTGVLQVGTNTGTVFAKCQPNATYTVSKSLSARFIIGETATLPANGVTVSNIIRDDTATHLTITTGPTAQYIVVFCHHSSDTMTLAEIAATVQIEAGSVASQYASYFTPIELCKIGDYQDYIYKSGDDWYVHKEIGNSILKGTEDWYLGQNLTNTSHFIIGDFTAIFIGAAVPPDNTTLGYCLSDHFEEKANLYNLDQVGIDFHFNKNLIVSVPNSISTTTANFKTWLVSNNTLVYYRLATPTDTKITDATLVEQLEALLEADTYNGKTCIKVTATDPNLPALLKVEAYKY